jgi:hypothetical protein
MNTRHSQISIIPQSSNPAKEPPPPPPPTALGVATALTVSVNPAEVLAALLLSPRYAAEML